jgi:adenosylcobinamide-GDP ribazoletransferase
MKSLLLALQFLTIIRFKNSLQFEPFHFASALRWFPIAGILIGTLQWICAKTGYFFGVSAQLTAIVTVAAGYIITGGLHLDGLADVADGFGAGRDRHSVLRIMKDDRLGVFAVGAIVFAIVARIAVSYELIRENNLEPVILAPIISRALLPITMTLLPYARNQGTGFAFSKGKILSHALPAFITGLFFATAINRQGAAYSLLAAAILSILFSAYVFYRIRGYTGDTLGCQIEISEIGILFAALR